jgi:4-hydroxyphenylpyruvate dioxygenase-like putative hemolysin
MEYAYMNDLILSNFWDLHPLIKKNFFSDNSFNNNDDILKKEANDIMFKRTKLGLNNLVKGLSTIIVNIEEDNISSAVEEFLNFTGYTISEAFSNESQICYTLKQYNSCDILLTSRKGSINPFSEFNNNPKALNHPNTRIECLVFNVSNIKKYYSIQLNRGVKFLTSSIIENDHYYFIQTIPSSFTGTSYGFIQWKNDANMTYKNNADNEISILNLGLKPNYTKNISYVDHVATRVIAKHRDAAILELMELTAYTFDFSIYVKHLNSITNVARMKDEKFALVFTSGISPFKDLQESGPTEKFVYNYGPRVHHIAFYTNDIDSTFIGLKDNGLKFLINLVGSTEEGIKQTFSAPSPSTLIVNEYICRYDDFRGFFTNENVRDLTYSTDKQ